MIGEIFNTFLVNPLFNFLVLFYKLFGNNMGLAIIAASLFVKVISFPLTHSSLKTMQKQKGLTGKLNELKAKYGHDKKKLSEEQLKLYKEAGINPASGCLMQIFPILVIIAFYSVVNHVFGANALSISDINLRLYFPFLKLVEGSVINPNFLYLNLSKPDHLFILPVLAALLQFLTSKMMMPAIEKAEKLAKKTEDTKDDVMYNVQGQMLYTMPIIFLIVGIKLPSGVVLNIVVTTIFSMVQQYFVSGFGGLVPWMKKLKLLKDVK